VTVYRPPTVAVDVATGGDAFEGTTVGTVGAVPPPHPLTSTAVSITTRVLPSG
jgi:hypothetical protein